MRARVGACMRFDNCVDKFRRETGFMRTFGICEDTVTGPHKFKVLLEG